MVLSMQRILVTGAAGFIGSHLCERLIQDGHEVWGIDNLDTGRETNLTQILTHPCFHFFKSDMLKYSLDYDFYFDVDTIIHLGAKADIVPSMTEPHAYFEANVAATAKWVNFARERGVKKFVYIASSSCYGIPDIYPTPEYADIRPMYPYALTKYLGEKYVLDLCRFYRIPAVSLRLFNVFGPRARTSGAYGAVFGVFIAQLLAGKPLTVVGDGTQTRDFTYVSDVVDAIVRAAESGVADEVFNVGSGGTYPVNAIVEELGARSVEYIPKRPGEPDCTFADIRKITKALGWAPKVSFKEGIKLLMKHQDDFKNAPVWETNTIAQATADWHRFLGKKELTQ